MKRIQAILKVTDEKDMVVNDENLEKTRPSYTDHYRILSFDDHYDEDNGILANVCRISDKRKFTLPLEDLEAVDRTCNFSISPGKSYFATIYWIPAFAGMTGAHTQSSFRRKPESSDCYPDLSRSYQNFN